MKTKRIKRTAGRPYMSARDAMSLLIQIWGELNGTEWSADTADAIASHFTRAGWTIREPDDAP